MSQNDERAGWRYHNLDLSGNGSFADAGEFKSHNAFNKANEWLNAVSPLVSPSRELDLNDGTAYTDQTYIHAYDEAGNMTSDGQNFTFVYDGWNRLVRVKKGANTATEYRYNGLGWRIAWHDGRGVNTPAG